MKIAIGTLREPKIQGIQSAIALCPYLQDVRDTIEYICASVPSDISDMPLSIEETIQGARNRANNLIKHGISADYYIGIEGGTTDILGKKYIAGVVAIRNQHGEEHIGLSPFLEVPEIVVKKLYEEGLELGPVMSELSGIINIASKNGSMGAWSDDMFTGKEEFELACKAALAPFFNTFYKMH